MQPVGYALAGVTFALPAAIAGSALAAGSRTTLATVAITALARVMITSAPRRTYSAGAQFALVALSDLLEFSLWCWSFMTRRVQWRHARSRVARDGTAYPIA